MSAARARIHAMFNLDADAEQELDARLDGVRAEAFAEAAALADAAVALFDGDEGALTAGALEGLADRLRQMAKAGAADA